jgi:lysozyme family protein
VFATRNGGESPSTSTIYNPAALSGGFFLDHLMTDIITLKAANAQRWASARLTWNFASVAKHLVSLDAKSRYQAVAAKTGVPWPAIAVIHERECSQDWTGSLAQGDPWNRVSVHVPAGRGPFKSWEEAAVDALNNCAPYAGRNKDWSIAGLLTKLEEYNGLGYAARGVPSPYVWSGADQYRSGKYVRDGVYDPHAIDGQLGCAGLLMAMMALDPTITFTGVTLTPADPKTPGPEPSVTKPAKGSIGAWIASILSAILKSKGR